MGTRNPCHCIIPPDLLEKLLEKVEDPVKRKKLLDSINLSAFFRGQRAVNGLVPVGASTGTRRRTIYDAQNGFSLPGIPVRREDDPPSADPAVNEAFDGLGATYDLFYEEYGRNSLDDNGMLLIATVHFGIDHNNASWDGSQMVFGDGDGDFFTGFTKAIDVIGHELAHGVVQHTCNLVYRFQPGALNESFADVFGSLVKQRTRNQTVQQADWLIGVEIMTPAIDGDALRSMKDPGTAFDGDRSVGHMDDFLNLPLSDDLGGVHLNSGIPNRAFFFLATELGGYAWKDAGKIWYLAMRRLTEQSDFQEAANVTSAAAGELFGSGSKQQQAVRGAWEQVGIGIERTVLGRGIKKVKSKLVEAHANGFDAKLGQLSKVVESLTKQVEQMGKKLEAKARR